MMNFGTKFIFVCVLLGVLVVWVSVTEADEDPQFEFDLADCKKVMARIAKRILKNFGICSRELKANVTGNREEFEKKLGCAVRCTMFRMELLDEDGKITRERIQKFMNEMVPKDAHEFAHALSADCNEAYGTKLDPNQEYCESYSEYATCMQNTVADFADKTEGNYELPPRRNAWLTCVCEFPH